MHANKLMTRSAGAPREKRKALNQHRNARVNFFHRPEGRKCRNFTEPRGAITIWASLSRESEREAQEGKTEEKAVSPGRERAEWVRKRRRGHNFAQKKLSYWIHEPFEFPFRFEYKYLLEYNEMLRRALNENCKQQCYDYSCIINKIK